MFLCRPALCWPWSRLCPLQEGNGVTLSNFVTGSSVLDCDFWRTGDSAIVAVGSTKLTNATASEYPHMNAIERNYIDTVGVNMKQTSCYFKAITYANTIRDNFCFNGPRVRLHFGSHLMVSCASGNRLYGGWSKLWRCCWSRRD